MADARRWSHGISVLTCAAAVAAISIAACGSDGENVTNQFFGNPEGGASEGGGGVGVGPCPANAKECVSDVLARTCPADGSSWLAVPCRAGEKCASGACAPDPNAACTPVEDTCTSATTALRCRANRQGFEVVTCPAGTACSGPGLCAGACVVGSSACVGLGAVATCADGNSFTTSGCAAGELCVTVSDNGANPRAACKPAACTPRVDGCNTVCGNKTNAAADQTKAVSECVETPEGFKWIALTCPPPTTCDPAGAGCAGGRQAGCRSDCTPGEQRCVADRSGHQTCDANGKWGATITPCNPTATATGLVCMEKPDDPTKVVCGDPLCARGEAGTCTADGKLRPCGPDGRVAAAAAATTCTSGLCFATGDPPIGGLAPGRCIVQCAAGDERCVADGATSYQTCANGLWSEPVACSGTTKCFDFRNAAGRPARVCGECIPATHDCVGDSIRTCSASGVWGAAAACALGRCVDVGRDSICLAECVPGATVCVGGPKTGVGRFAGTEASAACTANGLLPANPCPGGAGCCAGTTTCRKSATGVATGCVECVGPNIVGGNERALVDSRCRALAGGPGSEGTQACAATNTWPTAVAACGAGTSCSVTGDQDVCGNCLGGLCSQARLSSQFGETCQTEGQGIPIQCGITSDCCSDRCNFATATATPAHCR